VNLEPGQQDARRGQGCVVERVDEFQLVVLGAVADIDAAGLPFVEVQTRMGLAVPALAGYLALQVVHADFAVTHVACTDVHEAVGQLQGLHQLFCVPDQLFVPADRIFMIGFADHALLDLIELVDDVWVAANKVEIQHDSRYSVLNK
jgi:hypothetical protein